MRTLTASGAVLWIVAPFLLWLSAYRPFTASTGGAKRLPERAGTWRQLTEHELTPRQLVILIQKLPEHG